MAIAPTKLTAIYFEGAPSFTKQAPADLTTTYDKDYVSKYKRLVMQGTDNSAFGLPKFSYPQFISVIGTDTQVFGQILAYNKTQFVLSPAITTQTQVSTPDIFNRSAYVRAQGQDLSLFGDTLVAFYIRYLQQQGNEHSAYGMPWISRNPRNITPSSILPPVMPNPRLGGEQYVLLLGFEATQYGGRIIAEIQTVYLQGFSASIGTPTIQNTVNYIRPQGFTSFNQQEVYRFGQSEIYKLTQYVIFYEDNTANTGVQPFGQWTAIENRNKTIRMYGGDTARFGYQSIENIARVVKPTCFDSFTAGRALTAYRNRAIKPEPIESISISGWHVVYNDARVIQVKGFANDEYGKARVINTRRYFERIGNLASQAFSNPTIDYRVRDVTFEPRYSIEPPSVPVPTIHLYSRYIEVIGSDMSRASLPDLSIHWNIIAPWWSHYDGIGMPSLRNIKPEVQIYGANSEAFGQPRLRTQWRTLQARGDSHTAFGATRITDRTQHVLAKGFDSERISSRANLLAPLPPYSTQYITLTKGISIPDAQVPRPNLKRIGIGLEGGDYLKVGEPRITANIIRIYLGYDALSIGKPGISARIQQVFLTGVDNTIDNAHFGKPGFSPHHIYAPSGDQAPEGYAANHELAAGHIIDDFFERMGWPTIANRHHGVKLLGEAHTKYGTPILDLKMRCISPKGINAFRPSLPRFLLTAQSINQVKSTDMLLTGSPSLFHGNMVSEQHIIVSGLNSAQFGQSSIENQHRRVLVGGHDMLAIGYSRMDDNPYMWQSLHIGEPVPFVIGGDNMTQFGRVFISLRIRELQAIGTDMFSSEYEFSQFHKRMTVTRTEATPRSHHASIAGNDYAQYGIANIKNHTHYIHPDGNSETFRQGIGG